jgi:sugar phosphate isomerase/epimerase
MMVSEQSVKDIYMRNQLSRREFGAASMAAAAALAAPAVFAATASAEKAAKNRYCAFIKYLGNLKYDELAERIAELGFGGVEVTFRTKDGYIKPKDAAEEVPRLKKALEKQGLEITIATTDFLSADQEYVQDTLQALADNGVPRYRLGFYRYDLKQPIVDQVMAIKPKLEGLADLNRKLGLNGMYQNHSGADMFGATMWDLYYLLRDHPPEELSCVYDLRHATVEAGESWPTLYKVMKPHITAYSVKDFKWGSNRKSQHAALGEGMVDPAFYEALAKSDYKGPISVHVEYVKESAGADAQLAAIKRDFGTLKKWMSA